jgi:starch-binding outer membrane protein, SusD/RagB family
MKKQIRNTLKFIIVICITSGFLQACQEDWLDPKPLSIYTPDGVLVDEAGMESILLALREGLRHEVVAGNRMLASELYTSDIAICGSEVSAMPHNFNVQVIPTASTNNMPFMRYWEFGYNHIRNANTVISRIDGATFPSEQVKNRILAEGYFHRAYWYYRLVHQFGDVPFINIEHTAPKLDFFSHSRNTILDKIQEDLEFAVQYLPEVVDPGKVNRAAGNHLLTKVYLANLEFDKAIVSASAVINDGKYTLMTERFGVVAGDNRFNVIWDLHQKENKSIAANTEGILVSQDKYGFPGSQTSGTNTMRDLTPFWSHASYIRDPDGRQGMRSAQFDPQILRFGRGVGYVRSNNYFLWGIWRDAGSDLRHCSDTNWMSREKILYNNPASNYFGQPVQIQYTAPYDTMRSYFSWPHYKVYVANEPSVGIPTGGNSDWYVFRLAETYLLRAEAYYWKGLFAEAAADINKIRERALAPIITANDVTIEYILDERARELYYEEPRKTELTRIAFMMAEQNLNGYSKDNFHENNYWFDRVDALSYYNTGFSYGAHAYVISPFHVLWPVPQGQIDSNTGGRINQNSGYNGAENNLPPLTEITMDQ